MTVELSNLTEKLKKLFAKFEADKAHDLSKDCSEAQVVMLSSNRSLRRSAGTSKTRPARLTTGAMVATGIVFLPAAPLFQFLHGKDITIPKGTETTAYVNGDMNLDPGKFTALNRPRRQQPLPLPSRRTYAEDPS